MKPKSHPRFALLGTILLVVSPTLRAADGAWNVNENGLWSEAAKWTPDIADGAGFTASFAYDQTGDATITLDWTRTIGHLIFGDTDTATPASWLISGANPLTLSATTPTITVNALGTDKSATISSVIAGSNGLTKAGPGTLALTAVNTFSGGVTIDGGTLALSNGNQIPTANTITINAAGKLSTNSGAVTFAHTLAGAGTLDIASTAEVRFSGNWSAFGGTINVLTSAGGKLNIADAAMSPPAATAVINITNGATFFTSASKIFSNSFTVAGTGNTENRGAIRLDTGAGITGTLTLLGDASIGNSGATPSTISGIITDGGAGFGIRGAATGGQPIILTNLNTFTGRTTVLGGNAFSVSQILNAGNPAPLGTNGTIDFGSATTGGTLIYTGTGETTDRVINLTGTTGGGAITNNGTGPLKFTANVTATGVGIKTLTIQGTGNTELAGSISDYDATNTTLLTKAGTGTLTLSAASTFSGNVNLNGGTTVIAHPSALGANDTVAPNRLIVPGAGAANVTPVTLDLATDTSIDSYRFWGSSNNQTTVISNRATPGAGLTHTFAVNSGIGNNTYNFVAGPNATSGTAAIAFNSLWLAAGGAGTGTLNPTTAPVTILGPVNIGANPAAKTLNLGGTHTGNSILGTVSDGLAVLSLAKSNTGTWTVSGDRIYTGTTTVNGGTLLLTGTSVTTGATAVNGGLLVLQGDHAGVTAPTAATAVNGGTLRLDYAAHDTSKLANFAVLTLGGGTVELSGGSHAEVVASTTLVAGTSSTVTRGSGNAVLQMNAINPGAGALVNFTASDIATTDTTNTNGILGHWATVTTGGTTHWAVNSTNAADGPIQAFSGYTAVNRRGGTIPDDATANINIVEAGLTGNITLTTSPQNSSNTIRMDAAGGPAIIAPAGTTDVIMVGGNTGGAIWQTATGGGLTIGTVADDGFLTTGGASNATAAALTLINDSPTNTLVVNSTLSNNGTDVVSIAKAGAGRLVVNGTNSFTGSTSISGGSLQLGNSSALGVPATGTALTLAAGTTLDLNGFDTTVQNVVGHATGMITDTSAAPGTSTLSILTGAGSIATNILDGPTHQVGLRVTNANGGFFLTNGANTFSGGIVLTNSTGGTRLSPGPITAGAYGTGPITIGEAATDKAGIYFATANQTLTNPIIVNTALGTDRLGIRADVAGIVLSGQLTAGLAPLTFASNGTGGVTLTGKVTGPNGLVLTPNNFDLATTRTITVTLANAAGTNDYAGDTTVNLNPLNYKQINLNLGAAEQIPNGTGKGNLIVNSSAGPTNIGVGTLNLAGFSETVNGLTGNGTVTSSTGTPLLTVGDTDAIVDFTGVIGGSLALTKTGTGAMTLGGTAASTYTGVTTLNGGLITAGKATAFGAAGATAGTIINAGVTLNTNGQIFGDERFTVTGATIRNDGAADQIQTMRRLAVTGNTTLGGLRRWDIRGGTFGGMTVDPGVTVTKVDSNVVAVVQNPLVNNGTIQIDAGVFALHFASTGTGTGNFIVGPGAELQIGSYGVVCTVANPITVTDGTLAGSNDGGGASSFDGPITLNGTATARAEAAFKITGTISGSGGLNKTGVSTLTITAPVAYTGDTTVTAGTLALTTASTFSDASAVRLITGATLNLGATGTDQINELYIDGAKQTTGKWGRTGSIAALGATSESALITGDGLLQVGSGSSPFDLWATAKGLDGSPGKENTPTADPDGDGRSNLSEFAFDGNPLSGSDQGKVFVFTADSSDADTDEELVLTVAVRKTAPAFSGTPSPTASADGVTYQIQGDTALSGFGATVSPVDPVTAGLPAPGSDYEYRSFSLDGSDGLPGTGFLRAKVTAP